MANPAADIRNAVAITQPGAVVAARGRRHIIHQLPSGQRWLHVALGDLHYGPSNDQEIDSDWQVAVAPWDYEMTMADYQAQALSIFDSGQIVKYTDPGSGESVAFQPQQIQWSNDLGQIQAIADPAAVAATVSGDVLTWTDAYGPGLDFSWQTQTVRLKKLLTISSLASLPAPPQFIIDGGNPYLKLTHIFQRSANVRIWVNGTEWNQAANNPQITTGAVEFRNVEGTIARWAFLPAVAHDSGEEWSTALATTYVRRTGPDLFIETRVPYSWLQSAAYPVYIDPSVSPQVSASYDDAEDKRNSTTFSNSATRINLVDDAADSASWCGGVRFQVPSIASGDTIDSATLDVNVQATLRDDPNLFICGNDVDNGNDFNTEQDIMGRTRTTATVNWIDTGVGAGAVSSPDIASVMQEIVDRGGWAANQYMVFLMITLGTSSNSFRISSYDESSSLAVVLSVTYTAAAGGGQPMMARGHNVPGMRQIRPGRRGF